MINMHIFTEKNIKSLDENTKEKCYFCNKKAFEKFTIANKSLCICRDCDDVMHYIYY